MRFRSRIIGYGGSALLVVAGLAGGIGFGGTFGQLVALVLISLGLIMATALVFYEVGLSEDRERAREGAEAQKRGRVGGRAQRPGRGPRLGRRRGQRRQLGD